MKIFKTLLIAGLLLGFMPGLQAAPTTLWHSLSLSLQQAWKHIEKNPRWYAGICVGALAAYLLLISAGDSKKKRGFGDGDVGVPA